MLLVRCFGQLADAHATQLAGKAVARQAEEVVSHEEVLLIGRQKAEVMKSLVEKIVELIASAA